jgi:quinoprotein relay system zinc metallohydrolase 2
MLELIATLCLAASPELCVTRVLPGPEPCEAERAADWLAAHADPNPGGLVLAVARCAPLAAEVTPLPTVEVAPGVHVHKGRHELPDAANAGDQANIGFVVGTEAVAAIDAGGSRAVGEALYAAIRAETDLPIRWLVLTHMHPDHTLGASVFREAGATLVGHARLPDALANRAETYTDALLREAGPAVAIASTVVLPDETVADTRVLDLGGRTLVLEAHPTAHTDNDLTVLDEGSGLLWTGDLVFHEHAPSIDGSVLGWLAVLESLEARPVAGVVPGHGGPLLDWPAGAAPLRAYLEALVAETRAAIAAGESLGTATRHLGSGLEGEWQLFDAFNARNATAAYRELEWE